MEKPDKHPLMGAHAELDQAVRAAYGASQKADSLSFLAALNEECAGRESSGKPIVGPGLPGSA